MMRSMNAFLAGPSRFLFFTGKGGVGKTSLACAVSVALADAGKRVLLISTDPASNLGEVLETELGSEPRAIASVPGLFALNIDPEEAARVYRERIVGPYRGILPDAAVINIEEQLSGACTMEIASFNEFTRLIGDRAAVAGYDHVVLDTAPTGHTLRLLHLPAAWSGFIATNQSGVSCLGPLSGLQEQKATYERAVETLKDPAQTMLVLVARADRTSLEEAARAGGELRGQGIERQQLVINGVFRAEDPRDPIAAHLQAESETALADLPEMLLGVPAFEVPFRPAGTVGVQRLRELLASTPAYPSSGIEPESHEGMHFPPLEELVDEMSTAGRGVIMTMGKGGVGKTTLAIAIAQMLASKGAPVLLATTDPADHITGGIGELPDNITLEAIDPKAETRRHVAEVMATAGENLDDEARALLEEELRSPCIEEIAVFSAFARVVARGRDQFVVLDTAPTGHTILLLDTTEAYHRDVARNAGDLSEEIRELLPRLRDPEFTKVLVVTLPEATPVHEAAFLQEDLRRAGIEPYAWIMNRSLHGTESMDPLLLAKRANEGPYLKEVGERLAKRVALVPFRWETEVLGGRMPVSQRAFGSL